MIYVCGDVHGDITHISKRAMRKQNICLNKGDYLIILGDFGGVWSYPESRYYNEDKYIQKWLSNQPWTTLFIDGNHENHDLLSKYPVEQWNGGNVHHIIKDKVIHLMRGQVFNIEGRTIFTMGGAQSHDMEFRKEGINWWKDELPSNDDYCSAINNLNKVNWKVDYILTHCCCLSNAKIILEDKFGFSLGALLESFFEGLTSKVKYSRWYCGHYHVNQNLPRNTTVLYHKIIPLGEMA